MSSLISAHEISACLPDNTPLFQDFNFHLGKEKVGLIGKNGIGKTTLLRMIAQEIEPKSGKISVQGKISYLPQKTNDFSKETIATILNVDKKLTALKKAEEGQATLDDLNLIQEDWDYLRSMSRLCKDHGLGSALFINHALTMKILAAKKVTVGIDGINFEMPEQSFDEKETEMPVRRRF